MAAVSRYLSQFRLSRGEATKLKILSEVEELLLDKLGALNFVIALGSRTKLAVFGLSSPLDISKYRYLGWGERPLKRTHN
jgi:hypothetical protein